MFKTFVRKVSNAYAKPVFLCESRPACTIIIMHVAGRDQPEIEPLPWLKSITFSFVPVARTSEFLKEFSAAGNSSGSSFTLATRMSSLRDSALWCIRLGSLKKLLEKSHFL
jgi:hypothetical protein